MEYIIYNSVSQLPTFDKSLPMFCDIETDDLYGPLRMLQVYQPSTNPNVFIIDIAPIGYNKNIWEVELLKVENFIMGHTTVWYNSSYDLGTLNISPSLCVKHPEEVTDDTTYTEKVYDLFYAVKSAYPQFMEFGLKKIVKMLPYTQNLYDNIEVKEAVKGFIRGSYVSRQAYEYAAKDVYALSLIWEDKHIQYVIKENLSYKVDMMSQAYALIYQQNGLILQREKWAEALTQSKKELVFWSAKIPAHLNVNSYVQVRKYLDIEESDAEALISYALSDKPLASQAEAIIKVKKYMKEVSYLTSVNFDRMITKFNVAGAVSGRFTSSGGALENGFNAQQIPRQFQYLFNDDTEDTTTIGLDYGTLELRIACALFNGTHMYKQLVNGEDLHEAMAIFTSGKTKHPNGLVPDTIRNEDGMDIENPNKQFYISKNDRQFAKGINFGYVFGMSAAKYTTYAFTIFGIKVSMEESTKLRNAYFTLYPEFAQRHKFIWDNYKKPGFYVETALGRKIKPKLGTDGINIPVQGTGAECTKLAVHYMVKEKPTILKYIYNVVHDATYTRVPKPEEKYWEDIQHRNMVKGWTEISKSKAFYFKDIPMPVE